jgi:MoaA/NifB/PqqE/SkfB family radical SAM enzyme
MSVEGSWVAPTRIKLEASSKCQLRCPSCPTTEKLVAGAAGRGWLRAADFRRLLEENPRIQEVELANYGEMFLNPELLQIMEIAHARGVRLTADTGANLNHVRPEALEGLVRYRFHRIRCSIDGATPETYAVYRVGGDLEKVLSNLRALRDLKEERGSRYPLLTWQFIAFRHNEHEIERARELATELGMEFALKLSWDPELGARDHDELLRQELGAASRAEYQENFGEDYVQGMCRQLWEQPQINWDGTVLGCCRNFWGDFGGNVFQEGLQQGVNSEPMRYARSMLQGRSPARPDIPCTSCEIYQGMAREGRWVKTLSPPARLLKTLGRSLIKVDWLRRRIRKSPTLAAYFRRRV